MTQGPPAQASQLQTECRLSAKRGHSLGCCKDHSNFIHELWLAAAGALLNIRVIGIFKNPVLCAFAMDLCIGLCKMMIDLSVLAACLFACSSEEFCSFSYRLERVAPKMKNAAVTSPAVRSSTST